MRFRAELGRQVRVARSARSGSLWTPGLRHEAVDHAMEYDAVVEAFVDQRLDALDVFGREVGPQLDHDGAFGGLQRQLFSVGHRVHAFLLLRLSRKLTRNVRPATAPPIVSVNGIGAQRSIASATDV